MEISWAAADNALGVTLGVLKLLVLEIMPASRQVAIFSSINSRLKLSNKENKISEVETAVNSVKLICPKFSFSGWWSILMMDV